MSSKKVGRAQPDDFQVVTTRSQPIALGSRAPAGINYQALEPTTGGVKVIRQTGDFIETYRKEVYGPPTKEQIAQKVADRLRGTGRGQVSRLAGIWCSNDY